MSSSVAESSTPETDIERSRSHSSARSSSSSSGSSSVTSMSRNEILSLIPADAKSRFRHVGFALFGGNNDVYPIMELGPYDIPAGTLRDQYLDMVFKVSLLVFISLHN